MAAASFSQDQFSCSVCLDLLKDPVTIPCGHSYCMSCITVCWDQEDQKGVYSCPQCRHTFTPRPALYKNVMFAEMVEKLEKTSLCEDKVQARGGPGPAVPEDVDCDVCTETKHKAVKSCVECLNSYCQSHLEQHEILFKDRRHNLMDPTRRLHEMICSKHSKHLEIYCRTDMQCICYRCLMDEHKNHNIVTVEIERPVKQRLLGETQRKFQLGIQEKQKQLQELREAVKSDKRSAQAAVEDSERIFTQIIHSIERSRSEVTRLIRDQEKAAVSRAEVHLERLEQEIDDLRRKDAELQQLLNTDNHVHFLQMFQYISKPPESTDLHNITLSSPLSFHDVVKSVAQLKEKVEDFCIEELEKISDCGKSIEMTPSSELEKTRKDLLQWKSIEMTPSSELEKTRKDLLQWKSIEMAPSSELEKTRKDLLQYSCLLTLDSNTVNRFLYLCKENRLATRTDVVQRYPVHPDRFDGCVQVLCRESVCGRCYWEMKWSGSKGVCISVSYKSISRKGNNDECLFGFNNQSWALYCSPFSYLFRHDKVNTKLPVSPRCYRIGVFVDHSAGTLCFYSVSFDTMSLIHRVQTTFTQPLYPGFGLNNGSKVSLCHLTM